MSQNAWTGAIVAVVVIVGGVWWFTSQPVEAPVVDTTTTSEETNTTPATYADTRTQVGVEVDVNTAPLSATVTFNGDAFSPSTVTIAKGGKVTFTSTGGNMWVASDLHPQHTIYSNTTRQQHCPDTAGGAFDQCMPGANFIFTFTKTGTWNYHDHTNANLGGKVVVVD